jgi:hypothetical protein
VRLLLVDSDAAILLAASGLFGELLEALGLDFARARRLDALSHMLRRGQKAQKYRDLKEILLDWCEKVAPLKEAPENDEIRQLLVRDDIDPGEAVLFALLYENPGYLLTTGDKRCLKELASGEDLCDVQRSLSGRVICMETAIEILVARLGIRRVAAAFTPLRPYNRTLSVIFSRGEETSETDCLEALRSYIRELTEDVGPDFLFVDSEVTSNG